MQYRRIKLVTASDWLCCIFVRNCVQIPLCNTEILAFLRDSIWPPSAILDLLGVVVGPPTKVQSWWLFHVKISSWSAWQCWSYWCLNFCRSRLKVLFMGPKCQYFGVWLPKFRGTSFTSPKGTSLYRMMRLEPSLVQIGSTVHVVTLCILQALAIGEIWANLGVPISPTRRHGKTPPAKLQKAPLQTFHYHMKVFCNVTRVQKRYF